MLPVVRNQVVLLVSYQKWQPLIVGVRRHVCVAMNNIRKPQSVFEMKFFPLRGTTYWPRPDFAHHHYLSYQ